MPEPRGVRGGGGEGQGGMRDWGLTGPAGPSLEARAAFSHVGSGEAFSKSLFT